MQIIRTLKIYQKLPIPVQIAGKVDELIDAGDVASALPSLVAAAGRMLAGENKRRVWAAGGALPCPLAAPCAPAPAAPTAAPVATRLEVAEPPVDTESCDEAEPAAPQYITSDDDCDVVEAPAIAPAAQQVEVLLTAAEPAAGAAPLPPPAPAAQPPADHADTVPTSPVPLFLARFDAAWVHAELATMYVSHLEKERQYGDACALLRALLGGSACPGRRCVNAAALLVVCLRVVACAAWWLHVPALLCMSCMLLVLPAASCHAQHDCSNLA
jgi:hypothetical protein